MRPEMIEQNIRRLEIDMEAEIATIRLRYQDKIENLRKVLSVARKSEQTEQPKVASNAA